MENETRRTTKLDVIFLETDGPLELELLYVESEMCESD